MTREYATCQQCEFRSSDPLDAGDVADHVAHSGHRVTTITEVDTTMRVALLAWEVLTLAETVAAGDLAEQVSDLTEIRFRVMMHAFCVMVGLDNYDYVDDDDPARLATILAEARAWAWEGMKTGRTQLTGS